MCPCFKSFYLVKVSCCIGRDFSNIIYWNKEYFYVISFNKKRMNEWKGKSVSLKFRGPAWVAQWKYSENLSEKLWKTKHGYKLLLNRSSLEILYCIIWCWIWWRYCYVQSLVLQNPFFFYMVLTSKRTKRSQKWRFESVRPECKGKLIVWLTV